MREEKKRSGREKRMVRGSENKPLDEGEGGETARRTALNEVMSCDFHDC